MNTTDHDDNDNRKKPSQLEMLVRSQGYSIRAFADKCGISHTTFYNIVKSDVGNASINNVLAICKNLHISIDEFLSMMKGETENEPSYEDMDQLIARNGNKLTVEEKMALIKRLSALE